MTFDKDIVSKKKTKEKKGQWLAKSESHNTHNLSGYEGWGGELMKTNIFCFFQATRPKSEPETQKKLQNGTIEANFAFGKAVFMVITGWKQNFDRNWNSYLELDTC